MRQRYGEQLYGEQPRTGWTHLGRPMATTPDVPEDRLRALRGAYRATMADPNSAPTESVDFERT